MVAGVATVVAVLAVALGYVPPSQLEIGSVVFYEAFLILGIILVCAIPLIIYQFRKPRWKQPTVGGGE